MQNDDFSEKNNFSSTLAGSGASLTPITRSIVKALKDEQQRTGLTGYALMKLQESLPEGLTGNIINSWLDVHSGAIRRTPKHFLAFVLEAYKKQPDTPKRWRNKQKGRGLIPVTDEFRQRLLDEEKRTGVKIYTLLQRAARTRKITVTPQTASNWLNGKTKKADSLAMDELIKLYAALPSKKDVLVQTRACNKDTITSLREIPIADRRKLQQYRDVLGILPHFIFKEAKDVPEGLPQVSVAGWIDGSRKKADPKYVRWVLQRCRELVEEAADIDKY